MTDRTVIVGGGITGLAAAHELHRQGREFVVLDAADRVGGKVAGGPVNGAGLPFDVDTAADSFLAREPEMTDLCIELGLEAELTSPRPGGAFMWVDGALRRIPPGVLGAPLDPDAVADSGIVSLTGVEALRAGLAADLPPLEGDATVGEVLRPRVGDEVFARLVDPLIGGINAGTADEMSIRSGAAALANAAAKGGPFGRALREHVATAVTDGPVFHGVRGGSQRIIDALTDELGDRVRTGAEVFDIERDGAAWTVRTDDEAFQAAKVLLTTPGWVSAGLLAPHAPETAAILAGLGYADAVLITFVAHRNQVAHELEGAGFLVPRDQGLLMTACSVSSYKWEHYDDGDHVIMRVSAGRTDDGRWLEMTTDEVIAQLRDELRLTVGLEGDTVARVSEWRRCLPQYRAGHLERCDQIDEWLARGRPGIDRRRRIDARPRPARVRPPGPGRGPHLACPGAAPPPSARYPREDCRRIPSSLYGGSMAEDFPAKKKRRPRAELKELMIQGGVEVLQEQGVETQLSSVSYAKVFEHLERTQGVRITYGSVHERIWNSLPDYQLSVIERAGVWDETDPNDDGYSWVDWLQTLVSLSSGGADEAVADAARSGARNTYAARTDGFEPGDETQPLPLPADLYPQQVLAALSIAISDGLQLRSFLTGSDEATSDLHEVGLAILSDWFSTQAGA